LRRNNSEDLELFEKCSFDHTLLFTIELYAKENTFSAEQSVKKKKNGENKSLPTSIKSSSQLCVEFERIVSASGFD